MYQAKDFIKIDFFINICICIFIYIYIYIVNNSFFNQNYYSKFLELWTLVLFEEYIYIYIV